MRGIHESGALGTGQMRKKKHSSMRRNWVKESQSGSEMGKKGGTGNVGIEIPAVIEAEEPLERI